MSYKPQGGTSTNSNRLISPNGTTAQINAVNIVNGDIDYNSTRGKFIGGIGGTRRHLMDRNDQLYLNSNLSNARFTATQAGGTITLTLQDDTQNGTPSADFPVYAYMRHQTATTAEIVGVEQTGAVTLSIVGANTLGYASGVARRVFVYLVYDSGSLFLGVSATLYRASTYITTTAIGTGTSGAALYTTAAKTSASIRCIGFFEATNTAGSWGDPSTSAFLQEQMITPRAFDGSDVFLATEFTASAAADTWETVTGLSLTLNPGRYMVGYELGYYTSYIATTANFSTTFAKCRSGSPSEPVNPKYHPSIKYF